MCELCMTLMGGIATGMESYVFFILIAFYLELVLNGTLIELACACGYAGYFTCMFARSSSCYQSEYQDQ